MILSSKAKSGINSVSKTSIAKTICSLVDRLHDLYMVCHQAPSTHFDKWLSDMEISGMEISPLPSSHLLIRAWTILFFSLD